MLYLTTQANAQLTYILEHRLPVATAMVCDLLLIPVLYCLLYVDDLEVSSLFLSVSQNIRILLSPGIGYDAPPVQPSALVIQ